MKKLSGASPLYVTESSDRNKSMSHPSTNFVQHRISSTTRLDFRRIFQLSHITCNNFRPRHKVSITKFGFPQGTCQESKVSKEHVQLVNRISVQISFDDLWSVARKHPTRREDNQTATDGEGCELGGQTWRGMRRGQYQLKGMACAFKNTGHSSFV